MREWVGVRDDMVPIGDGFTNLQNVSLKTQGLIERRSGLSGRIATGLTALRIAAHDTSGSDQVTAPLNAPTASAVAGAGSGSLGLHTVRYRYYDSVRAIASAPSPTTTVTFTGGNQTLLFGYIANPLYDSIVVEMTTVGGGTFLRISAGDPSFAYIVFGTTGPSSVTFAGTPSDANLAIFGAYAGAVSTSSSADSWILSAQSANVQGISLLTGTVTSLLTGLTNATYYPSFAFLNQATYISNGVDAVRSVLRGDTAGSIAGIAAPTTAPVSTAAASGGMTAGTHLVRFRYWDQIRNRYSNPSPSVAVTTTTANASIDVNVIGSGDTSVGRIIVETTLANGTEYYQNRVVTNLSQLVNVTMSDQVMAVQISVNTYADPDGFGHEPPPIYRLMAAHRGRVFLWGPTSGSQRDLSTWSRYGYPESFYPSMWARSGTLANGDTPAALLSFQDDLYYIGRRSMTRLIYTDDPASGIMSPLPTAFGSFNQACAIYGDNAIYGFGRNGMWQLTGITPRHISDEIDDTWQTECDFSQLNDCFVAYDGYARCVLFHYSTSNGRGKKAACYHIDSKRWTFNTYLNEVSHSIQATREADNTNLFASEGITYAGDLWYYKFGSRMDGASLGVTNGSFSAIPGSTTTVANISPAAASSTFIGAYLYRPATGESRRISANTTSTITTAAFSTPTASGEELYVGPIDVLADPFWSTLQGITIERARASYCIMEHLNATAPEYRVSWYLDWSAVPTMFTKGINDTTPDGVTIPGSSSTYALVSPVNGVSAIQLPAEWNRVIRWRVQQIKPSGVVQLVDMRWDVHKDGIRVDRSQA